MTRKVLLAGLALLLIAIATAVIVITPSRAGLPTGCQKALDFYIGYRNSLDRGRVSAAAVVRASRPAQLTAELSDSVWGDSAYYQTDYHSRPEPDATAGGSNGAQRPVPYPPQEVWCALLEERGGAPQGFVFVALHQDLYNADWLVHQAADDPFAQESREAALALGCPLGPDAVKAASIRP